MQSLKEKSKNLEISLSELNVLIGLVIWEYPELANDNKAIAQKITDVFKITCTEEDVNKYESSLRLDEDYERESRRIEYDFGY